MSLDKALMADGTNMNVNFGDIRTLAINNTLNEKVLKVRVVTHKTSIEIAKFDFTGLPERFTNYQKDFGFENFTFDVTNDPTKKAKMMMKIKFDPAVTVQKPEIEEAKVEEGAQAKGPVQ